MIWNEDGKRMGTEPVLVRQSSPRMPGQLRSVLVTERLALDGAVYPIIEVSEVPVGVAEVKIMVEEVPHLMIAGHTGYLVVGEKQDGLQPLPAWFIIETK